MLDKGYGIMPNEVLFDEELSSTAKLVFVYISSLCASRGYCFATNDHFAEKFGITPSQISRHISSLSNYIDIQDSTSAKRRIYLRKNAYEPTQKPQGNLRKNRKHNITNEYYKDNITNNNTSPAKAVEKEVDAMALKLAVDFLLDIYSRYQWLENQTVQKKVKKQSEMYENIEKLHRIDGFDYETIYAVIEWVKNDSFWRSNILSGSKLRKQFSNLLVKIKETRRETVVL